VPRNWASPSSSPGRAAPSNPGSHTSCPSQRPVLSRVRWVQRAGSRQLRDSPWLKQCDHLGAEGAAGETVRGPGCLALMLGLLPPSSPTLLALASATGLWMQHSGSRTPGSCFALHQGCLPLCLYLPSTFPQPLIFLVNHPSLHLHQETLLICQVLHFWLLRSCPFRRKPFLMSPAARSGPPTVHSRTALGAS